VLSTSTTGTTKRWSVRPGFLSLPLRADVSGRAINYPTVQLWGRDPPCPVESAREPDSRDVGPTRSAPSRLIPTNAASAAHVETCGVRLPCRMSDADVFEQPMASTISESFTVLSLGSMSRRNSSGS